MEKKKAIKKNASAKQNSGAPKLSSLMARGREKLGLTHAAVGEAIGRSRTMIYFIETGGPKGDLIAALLRMRRLYKIPADVFFKSLEREYLNDATLHAGRGPRTGHSSSGAGKGGAKATEKAGSKKKKAAKSSKSSGAATTRRKAGKTAKSGKATKKKATKKRSKKSRSSS